MLEETLRELADLFRAHGVVRLANALAGMSEETSADLPRQVLGLFTHGMGGIFDPALYKDGALDRVATERRKQLAEQLFAEAENRLR